MKEVSLQYGIIQVKEIHRGFLWKKPWVRVGVESRYQQGFTKGFSHIDMEVNDTLELWVNLDQEGKKK